MLMSVLIHKRIQTRRKNKGFSSCTTYHLLLFVALNLNHSSYCTLVSYGSSDFIRRPIELGNMITSSMEHGQLKIKGIYIYIGVDTAITGNNNELELTVKSIVQNLLIFTSSQIFKLGLLAK